MAMPNNHLIDDDDIIMDYDDDVPALLETAPMANDTMMLDSTTVTTSAPTADDELFVPERIHIRGVDNLSTAQVEAYIAEHFSEKMERLEWIDDTSLNIVYENPALARAALAALSVEDAANIPQLELREAKPFSQSPDSHLLVRISKPSDRKERGARERSRYYLFHPEEDRGEARERRDRNRRRPRRSVSRDNRDVRDGGDGDYSRRYYDSREDGARRRQDHYADDMYDDAPKSTTRTRSRSRSPVRQRRYPRSRSPPRRSQLDSNSRRRSRSPIELFPSKCIRPSERPSKELFPRKSYSSTAAMDKEPYPISTPTAPASSETELFPGKPQTSSAVMDQMGISIRSTAPTQERQPFPSKERELFPERQQKELFPPKPRSLAERISLPPRSLAERISLPDSENSNTPSPPSNDLFARKMMSAKGEGLMSDGMLGGGGKRKRGRKKADEFM
ncbi:hypothetical protein BZA77DRAFT_302010 [Pyronema omphalodes]|nr:hypothetical protein BZA77DRAFT_302010 [Pyronema omphalodes]